MTACRDCKHAEPAPRYPAEYRHCQQAATIRAVPLKALALEGVVAVAGGGGGKGKGGGGGGASKGVALSSPQKQQQ